MENSIKDRIMSAADDYLRMNGLTAAELLPPCGVSASYYSVAAKEIYVSGYRDKGRVFRKLASAIGMRLETSYWQHADTTQYVQIVNTLDEARERCEARMVLGETGCGKTYAIDRFCGANPRRGVPYHGERLRYASRRVGRARQTAPNRHEAKNGSSPSCYLRDAARTVPMQG